MCLSNLLVIYFKLFTNNSYVSVFDENVWDSIKKIISYKESLKGWERKISKLSG